MIAKGGRKKIPIELHVLNGNPSKLNLKKISVPKPKPLIPKCPGWLSLEAKREWRRIAPELHKLGLLTIVDGAALASHCQNWARWMQAEKIVEEHFKKHGNFTIVIYDARGNEREMLLPEIGMANKYSKLVRDFSSEFGLTPSARSRINLKTPDASDDPMEGLLTGTVGG